MNRFRTKALTLAAAGGLAAVGIGAFSGVASAAPGTPTITPATFGGSPEVITYTGNPAVGNNQGATLPMFFDDEANGVTLPSGSFPADTTIYAEECQDPGGLVANLPTSAASCDGDSIQHVAATAAGAVSFTGASAFPFYYLPNATYLDETSPTGVDCDWNNPCVLFIGENINNFATGTFTFSSPFYMTDTDASAGPPADTPQFPYGALLPIAAAGLIGGGFVVERRRRSHRTTSISA